MRSWISNARAQAVLMDLDGVLLDSRGLHDAALVEAYEKLTRMKPPVPLPWTDEGIRSIDKLLLLGVDSTNMERIRQQKAKRYLQLLDDGYQRWHSPMRLRAALQGLTAVALVASFSWEGGLARVLNTMGLVDNEPFDQIFAPYEGNTPKGALYSAAASWLTRCRRVALTDALVLEDSDAAMEAAKTAGFSKIRQVTYEQLGATL